MKRAIKKEGKKKKNKKLTIHTKFTVLSQQIYNK